MATAGLRALMVAAAVILGIFVLSRAFPTDGATAVPTEGTNEEEPVGNGGGAPPPSPSPTPTQPQGPGGGETPNIGNVSVQVLNGTDSSGLAEEIYNQLGEAGWNVADFGNATQDYQRSVIFYKPEARDSAEFLREHQFPKAQLERAARTADADITVVLGQDAAPGG